jgi:hypothetical protein
MFVGQASGSSGLTRSIMKMARNTPSKMPFEAQDKPALPIQLGPG